MTGPAPILLRPWSAAPPRLSPESRRMRRSWIAAYVRQQRGDASPRSQAKVIPIAPYLERRAVVLAGAGR